MNAKKIIIYRVITMQLKAPATNRCNKQHQKYIKKRNLITIDNKPIHVYIASEEKIFAILYTRLKVLGKIEFYTKPSTTVA